MTTATDFRSRLRELYDEQEAAARYGLSYDGYLDDLQREIDTTRAAYIGAAVSEIATLQGELGGRNQG